METLMFLYLTKGQYKYNKTEHLVIPTFSLCVFLDSEPIEFSQQCLCTLSDRIRLNNQLLWAGGLLFCFMSMHKFSVLLTDCCLRSLHTHTQVLLYKRRLSEAVWDEFGQSYANVCTEDIPKSRHEGTVDKHHPNICIVAKRLKHLLMCTTCFVPWSHLVLSSILSHTPF